MLSILMRLCGNLVLQRKSLLDLDHQSKHWAYKPIMNMELLEGVCDHTPVHSNSGNVAPPLVNLVTRRISASVSHSDVL